MCGCMCVLLEKYRENGEGEKKIYQIFAVYVFSLICIPFVCVQMCGFLWLLLLLMIFFYRQNERTIHINLYMFFLIFELHPWTYCVRGLIVDLFVAQHQNCLELILKVVDIDLIWMIIETRYNFLLEFHLSSHNK